MSNSRLKTQNILILAILFCLPFYFIKLRYSWVSLNLVEIITLILFVAWIFNKNKKIFIFGDRYFMPVSLISVGLFSSVIVNRNYYLGFGIIKGWFLFPILFAIIVFDCLRKDEKLLNKIFFALFASGVFVSVEGLYYWFSGLITYDGRLRVFFDSPNQLAMFLAPAFLIGMIVIFRGKWLLGGKNGKRKAWKWSLVLLGIFLIWINLYLSKSYGAWIALALALAIVFWLEYGKIWQRKYLATAIIAFLIIISVASFFKYEEIKNIGERSSLASRVMIWKAALRMIEKSPVFGVGPGNFQNTYLEYQKYFSPYLEWAVPQPHNLFLAFWLETGISGLIGFIWLLWLFFSESKKARKKNFGAATLCFAIILYSTLHGLTDTTYWRNDMAFLFWTAIAVNHYFFQSSLQKEQNS
jgi:O-antigen ligase